MSTTTPQANILTTIFFNPWKNQAIHYKLHLQLSEKLHLASIFVGNEEYPCYAKFLSPQRDENTRLNQFLKKHQAESNTYPDWLVQYYGSSDTYLFMKKYDTDIYSMLYGNTLPLQCIQASLTLERRYHIAVQCCRIVEILHQMNTPFRDIKPNNFLYDVSLDKVVLCDMETVRVSADKTVYGLQCGTQMYMANEVFFMKEFQKYSYKELPSAEMYSLGILLVELIFNVRPWDGSHFSQVNEKRENEPSLKPYRNEQVTSSNKHLDELIWRCFALMPSERPVAAELHAAISVHLMKNQELLNRCPESVKQSLCTTKTEALWYLELDKHNYFHCSLNVRTESSVILKYLYVNWNCANGSLLHSCIVAKYQLVGSLLGDPSNFVSKLASEISPLHYFINPTSTHILLSPDIFLSWAASVSSDSMITLLRTLMDCQLYMVLVKLSAVLTKKKKKCTIPFAFYCLGYCYEHTNATEKAIAAYQFGANKFKEPECIFALGLLASKGVYLHSTAEKLLVTAASLGVSKANVHLLKLKSNNQQDAIYRSLRSAMKNDASLIAEYAWYCHFKGNHDAAMKLYQVAANKGSVVAQYNLGICFMQGIGTCINLGQAKIWFEIAAKANFAKAQQNFAQMLNNQTKYEWLTRAALQGNKQALFTLMESAEVIPQRKAYWHQIYFDQRGYDINTKIINI